MRHGRDEMKPGLRCEEIRCDLCYLVETAFIGEIMVCNCKNNDGSSEYRRGKSTVRGWGELRPGAI